MASRVNRAHKPTHHVKGQHLGRRCKYFILPFFVNVASFLKSNCQNWFRIYSGIYRVLYLFYELFLFLPVNRIKTETGTSILIPSNNEHSNVLRIEGSPKGVALAKEEILQMVKKLVSKTSPHVFLLLHVAPDNLLYSPFKLPFLVRVNERETSGINRDFKIQQRGRRQKRHENNRFYNQNNNFTCASRSFVHFFTRFWTTTTWKCLILRFMEYANKQWQMIFLFLSLDMVPRNSTPGGLAFIWQSKWVGIIAIKTGESKFTF